jgi:hypothetical protein
MRVLSSLAMILSSILSVGIKFRQHFFAKAMPSADAEKNLQWFKRFRLEIGSFVNFIRHQIQLY